MANIVIVLTFGASPKLSVYLCAALCIAHASLAGKNTHPFKINVWQLISCMK